MSTRSEAGKGERGSELLSLVKVVLRTKDKPTQGFLLFRPKDGLFSEGSSLPRLLALTAAGLLLAALPAVAKSKAAPVQTATIINTGSTNTLGYTVRLYRRDGITNAVWVQTNSEPIKNTNKSLVKSSEQLFRDLDAAMPLINLPMHYGMRSASFGTRTLVNYKGQQSPDLTFASDPRTIALKADIDAITKTLHIGNAPRRPIVIHSDR